MRWRFWADPPSDTQPIRNRGVTPFAGLAAVVGAATVAILVPTVQQWEGTERRAYRDIAGIWTICTGDTYDVRPGQVASKAECEARLERQLIAHAKPVLRCVPGLKGKPNALAASTSLAYNIGPTAFCRSTVARRFNAEQGIAACNGFLKWDKARVAGKLRPVRGLTNRRRAERMICLRDF